MPLDILAFMNQETQEAQQAVTENNSFLATSILVASLIIGGSLIYSTRATLPTPADNGQNGNVQAGAGLGKVLEITSRDVIAEDAKAPVTIIEYGDYQCPFCARFFSQTEPLIRANYIKSGKVKMVYRDFAFLGPESIAAAEAAECAKDQGKFWAYHDALYQAEEADAQEHNGNLNRALFVSLAKNVGMDATKFGECFDSKKYTKEVQDEINLATSAGINSTPSFLINGELVKGAIPYAQFKTMIDAALAK